MEKCNYCGKELTGYNRKAGTGTCVTCSQQVGGWAYPEGYECPSCKGTGEVVRGQDCYNCGGCGHR